MTRDFPTIEEVSVLHETLIREFGGLMALRVAPPVCTEIEILNQVKRVYATHT